MRLFPNTCAETFPDMFPRYRHPFFSMHWSFALVLSILSLAAPAARGQAAAPGKAKPVAAAEPRPTAGGMHEGIKVHGHWVIEVRRPDGKLYSHTEFENNLIGTTGLPFLFLLRQLTSGEWGIVLGGSSSPCTAIINGPFGSSSQGLQNGIIAQPYCVISEAGPFITPSGCAAASGSSPASSCSRNLQLGASNIVNGFTLTGSVLATTGGTAVSVSQVETIVGVCGPGVSSSTCATETSPDGPADAIFAFTAATLPATNTTTTPCSTTGAAGEISCAVTIPEAGDTINVQVTISFQ